MGDCPSGDGAVLINIFTPMKFWALVKILKVPAVPIKEVWAKFPAVPIKEVWVEFPAVPIKEVWDEFPAVPITEVWVDVRLQMSSPPNIIWVLRSISALVSAAFAAISSPELRGAADAVDVAAGASLPTLGARVEGAVDNPSGFRPPPC